MIVEQYKDICRVDPTLRDYQQEAKQAIFEAWDRINSIMLQMPTGTGKTKLFSSIIHDINKYSVETKQPVKIVVIAHRTELIEQIDEHLTKYSIPHGIIAGGFVRDLKLPVQVASIQTLSNNHNKEIAKNINADFLIVDEAHHSLARTYKSLWNLYPNAKRLGVTATPWRMSGNGFTDLFDDIILSWTIKKFIKQGFLSNYNYFSLKQSSDISQAIDTIDEFDIEGDYKVSALERTMNTNEIRAQLLDSYLSIANGKKGIIYAISQAHSKKICEEYEARGIKIKAIDSHTPKKERKQIVDDFRKGDITIIVNVDIFSEGFDCPDIEFIQLARPTRSLAKYLQQVGRALRPTEQKEHAVILDNVGMYQRFGLPDSRRHWRHHFIGSNNSTNEIEQAIARMDDGAGRVFNLKEGHEDMVLIQQTADILGVEGDVEITKEFKLGPIQREDGSVWLDPKHTYRNGIHYYDDMYGRKFCMYADENSVWHFDRIISSRPMVRKGLISHQLTNAFSFYCNVARAYETYVSYLGIYDDERDESLLLMDFWNPIAPEDEKHIFFNYCGDEFDEAEAIAFKSEEIDNAKDEPEFSEIWFAIADSIRGKEEDGIPLALLTYKVEIIKIRMGGERIYQVRALLNDGTSKIIMCCNKGSDFANRIDWCERNNLAYEMLGVEDRHLRKRKDRYTIIVDNNNPEEILFHFDVEGNSYDEKNCLLNQPKSKHTKKKKSQVQNTQKQFVSQNNNPPQQKGGVAAPSMSKNQPQAWSSNDLTQLISLYGNTPISTIAFKLKRDVEDVKDKMRKLKLID